MRKVLLPMILLSMSLAAVGQGLAMKATPSSVSILPGEPISVKITITNTSGKKMEVLGESLVAALAPFPLLYTRASKKLNCWGGPTGNGGLSDDSTPYSRMPRCTFEANAAVTIPTIVGSHTMCPLHSVPPGSYVAKLTVEIDLLEGESKRTAAAELEIPVEVRQAQGVDAAYLDALQKALIQYEAENKNAKFPGQSLKWIEVLTPLRVQCNAILLEKYPTSTYAGYLLAKKAYDYSSPLFKPVTPADQVRISREEGKTVVAFPDNNFECYFKQLDAFMKGGRVPQDLAAALYGFYGDLLVQRGRLAEAETAFKEAIKTEPADPKGQAYYYRAQDFLKALEGKATPGTVQGSPQKTDNKAR